MKDVDPMTGRCTATSRTGKRCKLSAIPGGTVCRFHGGAAPQVIRKASERLAEVRDAALVKLAEYIMKGEIEDKVILDAVVKLTQLTEVLDGRVSNREETIEMGAVEREIMRLERQFAAKD